MFADSASFPSQLQYSYYLFDVADFHVKIIEDLQGDPGVEVHMFGARQIINQPEFSAGNTGNCITLVQC